MGRYCSYLLPKQTGGTTQILVFKTLRMTGRPTVYVSPDAHLDRTLRSNLEAWAWLILRFRFSTFIEEKAMVMMMLRL